jgi:hypothetical protein
MDKTLKAYSDGSELTVGGLAAAIALGAIGATTIVVVKEFISHKRHNRKFKVCKRTGIIDVKI